MDNSGDHALGRTLKDEELEMHCNFPPALPVLSFIYFSIMAIGFAPRAVLGTQ